MQFTKLLWHGRVILNTGISKTVSSTQKQFWKIWALWFRKKATVISNLISKKLSLKTCLGTIITELSNHKNGMLYQVANKMARFDWLFWLVVLIGCWREMCSILIGCWCVNDLYRYLCKSNCNHRSLKIVCLFVYLFLVGNFSMYVYSLCVHFNHKIE